MEDKTLKVRWRTIFAIACAALFFSVTITAVVGLPDLTPVLLGQTPDTEWPSESLPEDKAGSININTATKSELVTLNGIGETLAERIIDYREKHGAFKTPQDLLNVPGIGEGKLENILDKITV